MMDSSGGGGVSNSSRLNWKEGLGLLGVFSFIGAIIYGACYLQDIENQDRCMGKYNTSACFELKAKEAKAKEEYLLKVEGLRNGSS